MLAIHIGEAPREPRYAVTSVRAIPRVGLQGDRYNRQGSLFKQATADREVTLIEQEALDALQRDYQVQLSAAQSRRNILTQGIALNHLVDREFIVGAVRMRGLRLCEPCGLLERLTGKKLSGLKHRGGLRAQVLSEGEIKVGDAISGGESARQPAPLSHACDAL